MGQAVKHICVVCLNDPRVIVRGVVGQVKARLPIYHAPKAVIAERRAKCEACPRLIEGWLCPCGCPIKAKTLVAAEVCFDDPPRWGAA